MNIMRTFVFLCCLSAFSLSPNNVLSQNAKVSIKTVKTVTVDEVFDIIMNQTDYNFIYQEGLFNSFPKITLKKGIITADNLLRVSLSGGNFNFDFLNKNTIVIKEMAEVAISSFVQTKQITGKVLDKTGMPVVGATVLVEGTSRGKVTNFDGEYKISLGEDENVLVFSSLGYKTVRTEVGARAIVNVTMEEDFGQLDEIVIIGYGKQKREDVTGAVSSVKTKDIVQSSIGSVGFDRALGGLVKGVNVSQSSGRPGAPVRLNIRGVTSPLSGFGGLNQPLYVIDGVPFNIDALGGANPLLTINPADIESFDVLKDAGATSIYGSRGANGVIIINTKKGKRNQAASMNFSYTTSLAKPINSVKVLNASQYRNFYDILIGNTVTAMNAGQIDPFFAFDLDNIGDVQIDFSTFPFQVNYNGLRDSYFGDADTDWNKEVFRNIAVTKQANFSVNGGGENNNYAISLAFIDQEGLTKKDNLKQYTLNMSLDTNLNKNVKIGGTVSLGHTESDSGEDDIFGQYTLNSSIAKARPDLPVYDDNGQLLGQTDFSYGFATFEPNPLMRLENKTNRKNYNFIGNSYIEVEPIKNLKLKADVNAAVFYSANRTFVPQITQTDFVFFPNQSFLSESRNLVSNVTTNLTANYNFRVNDNRFSFLLGAAWDRTNFDNSSQFYIGFPDDDVLINGSSAESVGSYSSNRLESGLNSFFSRVTYGYKNLYNATLNFRTDVSSKFGPGNRRAYFPSLSTSWNISNEDFLKDSSTINNLKLRASVGAVGSTNISDFAYLQFFKSASDDLYNGSSAILPNDNFPNTNIGWEETKEVNLGLDFELLNSRLRGSIDVYSRKTTGALVSTPLPLELGPNSYFANFIDVTNKGVELAIGGDIIKNENFTWSANVNWSLNRNKLDKLNGANINQFQLDYFVEGEPVGTIKGYKVVKIFQDQAEVDALNTASSTGLYDQIATSVGDYMYEDLNNDGRITTEDRTILGDIEADYFGGISNTFTYKNLSLSTLMQYSVGGERTWNNISFGTLNILGENKYSEYGLNTWTPENTDARYARALYFDASASSRTSDRYLYDTSYLRLKSVQLSYTFDHTIMNQYGINNARLFLTGTNLLTFTNWPGMDPETFSERGGITDQVDNEDPYPLAKAFSLGIQVQF
ncbi:SusC/RagA family TonB-linked outer membrane protein [Polaribacter sp. IC073]|uniref:SusC/RagA family TonB-linked outer membrane protein n=1 Tax=Polaribacter sp. IC073 TaxID=2508540 RepID=UPI001CB99A36|nr:TonB-dependent receptor [Polaribacter sp. IC073]